MLGFSSIATLPLATATIKRGQTFSQMASLACATATSLVSALAIRAVLAQVACTTSVTFQRAVALTRAISSVASAARTSLTRKSLPVASATATALTKQGRKIASMAVSTAVASMPILGKNIAIAVQGTVTATKAIARKIIVTCITQVIRAVSSGLFPVIRKQRPRLQKSRETNPTLNKFK